MMFAVTETGSGEQPPLAYSKTGAKIWAEKIWGRYDGPTICRTFSPVDNLHSAAE